MTACHPSVQNFIFEFLGAGSKKSSFGPPKNRTTHEKVIFIRTSAVRCDSPLYLILNILQQGT